MYAMLLAAGLHATAEVSTQFGRADIVVEMAHTVYVVELKIDSPPTVALQQIEHPAVAPERSSTKHSLSSGGHGRRYYEKYLNKGKEITLLRISFDILVPHSTHDQSLH
jgi:hypothetical protein